MGPSSTYSGLIQKLTAHIRDVRARVGPETISDQINSIDSFWEPLVLISSTSDASDGGER